MSKWISVQDNLPDPEVDVLLIYRSPTRNDRLLKTVAHLWVENVCNTVRDKDCGYEWATSNGMNIPAKQARWWQPIEPIPEYKITKDWLEECKGFRPLTWSEKQAMKED